MTQKTPVASDTGPLLSAFQCGRVDLMVRTFGPIYLVDSIVEECRQHGAGDDIQTLIEESSAVVIGYLSDDEQRQAQELARQIAASPYSKVIAASPYSKVADPLHHLPEAELMIMARRCDLNCEAILLEEKAARDVAQHIGLEVTGFVGVLIQACRDGLLEPDDIRTLLHECRSRGTRYTDALIEDAVRRAGGE